MPAGRRVVGLRAGSDAGLPLAPGERSGGFSLSDADAVRARRSRPRARTRGTRQESGQPSSRGQNVGRATGRLLRPSAG
eukprot:11894954-Alexandrium_andersonii.AAC.1